MSTKALLVLSGIFWTFVVHESGAAAVAIVVGVHALMWQIHNVEAKVNKLLDSQNIRVEKSDFY